MEWTQLFYVLGIALAAWLIYRSIRGRPQMFSKENLGKSFFSMAVLGLILIAFVAFLVFILRN